MKRTAKTVSVLVFISLLFFACHSVNIGMAEDGGTADKHPLSAISVLRDLIDEINRLDEEMAQMGYYALPTNLFMKFVEPVEPYDTIDESQLPIQEGSVDLTVAARIEEREFDGSSEFSAVVLLTVNGRMVDFEMDGSRSTDGILIRSFQSNRDYLLPVHADIYACLVEERTGKKVSNMHLYYTAEEGGDPRITFPYDREAVEKTMAVFDETVGKIMRKDFSGRCSNGRICHECDFRHYCRRKA